MDVKAMRHWKPGWVLRCRACVSAERPLEPTGDTDDEAAVRLLETYDRLLAALDQAAEEAGRAGADGIREWVALAALDAVYLGAELGMLHDDEAERRREAIRDQVVDLDHRI